ncbi:hypothetical protein KCP73_12460 [Salmonella enterica subsp. enterica]|nr:hypothetical protein KCP73_12460 [Salmonella enterica subsp. enterica]
MAAPYSSNASGERVRYRGRQPSPPRNYWCRKFMLAQTEAFTRQTLIRVAFMRTSSNIFSWRR